MKIAIIQNNVCESILDLATEEQIQTAARAAQMAIDITDANPVPAVGWVLLGNQLVNPAGDVAPTKKITKLGFRQRFTFSELIALTGAAQSSNPSVALPLQVLLNNLAVATYIDLNRADTAGGMGLLVSFGLLTSARSTEILSAEVADGEKYKGDG